MFKLLIWVALIPTFGVASVSNPRGESICPRNLQKILVLDLKSGWWGGDGGDFHKKVYQELNARCPGLIEFEFRHTPYGSFQSGLLTADEIIQGVLSPSGRRQLPTAFFNGIPAPLRARDFPEDWSRYQQVWLLSGGEADLADMRIDSVEFKEILKQFESSHVNVLIGTGFGNIYHANPVAKVLGLGEPIATDKVTNIYPMPHEVKTLSWLKRGQQFLDHPIFGDLQTLPERVRVGGYEVASDWIKPEAISEFGVLASNFESRAIIAATCGCNGRKTFVDTGLQRFYSLVGDFPGVMDYLLGIAYVLQT